MSEPHIKKQSFRDLVNSIGVPVLCEGNQPVNVADTNSVWYVEKGVIDLFLNESQQGTQLSAPQHLLRLEQDSLLPSIVSDVQVTDEGETTLSIIAKGLQGTILKRIPTSELGRVSTRDFAKKVDAWIEQLMGTLSRYVTRIPRATSLAKPGTTQTYHPGTLGVSRGVVWFSGAFGESSLFMGTVAQSEPTAETQEISLPLTRSSWLSVFEIVAISTKSTETLVNEGTLLTGLACFHKLALRKERLNRQFALVDDANLERERIENRQTAEQAARSRLFNIYGRTELEEFPVPNQELFDALKYVGQHEDIEFVKPNHTEPTQVPLNLSDILDSSGVRARRVQLDTKKQWWRTDSHALLAFRSDNQQPVALIPGKLGRYRAFDPVTGKSSQVTQRYTTELSDEVWMFYKPLPNGEIHTADLIQLALRGSAWELLLLILLGFGSGLIKLTPALMLGFVANLILNNGNSTGLYPMLTMLIGIGILGLLLHILQRTVLMRVEARTTTRLEAAFWDRLMRLPPDVLQTISSGRLAMTGMTFQQVRDGLHGVVINSLLSVLFLLPIFGIIIFFDLEIGLILLGFSVVALAIGGYLGVRQISPFGRMNAAVRRVTGLLFEMVGGITKLRVENAEGSAFAMWAQEYRKQKRAELYQSKFQNHAKAFRSALPFLASAAFLVAVFFVGLQDHSISSFLVFYTIFMIFQYVVGRFAVSCREVAAILPALSQIKPLLVQASEVETAGEAVKDLRGHILFDHVSFRYTSDGPLILDDVTIRAKPGEFIAIAGESGSGKTTLFRLALGMVVPTAGAVYYDGRDLRHLNLRMLRRKIGAVPQSVRLHPQDIWDNLAIRQEGIETEDIWKIARAAKIEDEIKAMPMGMMTTVGSSGSVVSGGESQRISIARALLGNPRVILFDEATNWLDNKNQADIMHGFEMLTSTRLVIAHRLSTLEHADQIYVLQSGKIVQTGTFNELMEVEGVFKDLVKRQLV